MTAPVPRPAESHDGPVRAQLRLDLNRSLHFGDSRLLLTARGLQFRAEKGHPEQDWSLTPDLSLRHRDRAGIGVLELCNASGRLAWWRYTLAQDTAVRDFCEQFRAVVAALDDSTVSPLPVAAISCPHCGSRPDAATGHCPRCINDEEQPPSMWALLRLWRFARPYRWRLLAGLLLTLASTAATLVPPYLTMPLMDDVLIPFQNGKPIDSDLVTFYLSGLLLAALTAWGLGWARTLVLAAVSERLGSDLRITTFNHLLHLSQDYFSHKRTGDLIARLGSGSDRIVTFISLHLVDFCTDVLMILMTACILFWIDPLLAAITLLPLPFIAWLIYGVRERLRLGFERAIRIWAEITNVLTDTIPGIRVVKAFAQESREVGRFRHANLRNRIVNDRVNRLWSVFGPTVTLLTEVGLLVIWAFGIWQIARGEITVGVLTAFLSYIGRFYTRLDSMSRIVNVSQKAAAAAKRLFDVLDHVPSVPEPANPVRPARVNGRLELRKVSFRHGVRTVTDQVSLTIEPGEMVGLVGASGAGKSTLVNLICRFHDVDEGSILLDGIDIRSIAVRDYRRCIGLVLQEPFLFFGTIAENIAYGRPDASRSEIVAAARAARAHDFILRLPQGYDSLTGERGQSLSGGERQRISIARALLIDPKILILDEATSSVDSRTEQDIQDALDTLVRGRTTLAVAHRLSTLRKADRLVVLEQGRIIETGSHTELLEKNGHYARLWHAQHAQATASAEDRRPCA